MWEKAVRSLRLGFQTRNRSRFDVLPYLFFLSSYDDRACTHEYYGVRNLTLEQVFLRAQQANSSCGHVGIGCLCLHRDEYQVRADIAATISWLADP